MQLPIDYEWKSLANAVIHDGFDPRPVRIVWRCDKCGCEWFHMAYQRKDIMDGGRTALSIYIVQCPECGAKEMECIGTYHLPDVMPGTILSFIGHFMMFWTYMVSKANRVLGVKYPEDSELLQS